MGRMNGSARAWRAPVRSFVFFRSEGWYVIDIPEDQVIANVELNPGTLRVEDLRGNVVWRPN